MKTVTGQVSITISPEDEKQIALEYLCKEFGWWNEDYFIEDGMVKERVTNHTTHAWDDLGSSVKLYLSLGQFVDELVSSDVAVRFSSGSVRVKVRDLTFERKLFAAIKPSKCTFKVNEEKRVVVVALRKKRKDEAWAAFAADVNADPCSTAA
mgnify:CR=1 FL=1